MQPFDFGATFERLYEAHERASSSDGQDLPEWALQALAMAPLGHPQFKNLRLGQRRSISQVSVFLDLTDFTGRTFWDSPKTVTDLAHAVLSTCVAAVSHFGGHPIGLRGDGLFAAFDASGPDHVERALTACKTAMQGVHNQINPRLRQLRQPPAEVRAGLDYGEATYVRTGSSVQSEVNVIGFSVNFAAKCESIASSGEIVVGEGYYQASRKQNFFRRHNASPKVYTRGNSTKSYHFYSYKGGPHGGYSRTSASAPLHLSANAQHYVIEVR